VVTNIHFLTSNLRKQLWASITIELENDINVTRGDMIVKSSELPKKVEKEYTVCWMDSKS
jgi:sulfate adenylyltransferase subunit 1